MGVPNSRNMQAVWMKATLISFSIALCLSEDSTISMPEDHPHRGLSHMVHGMSRAQTESGPDWQKLQRPDTVVPESVDTQTDAELKAVTQDTCKLDMGFGGCRHGTCKRPHWFSIF